MDVERNERLKLEHAIKTGSLPDDAKVNFSSAASALSSAAASFNASQVSTFETAGKMPVPPPPPPPLYAAAPPAPPPGAPPLPPAAPPLGTYLYHIPECQRDGTGLWFAISLGMLLPLVNSLTVTIEGRILKLDNSFYTCKWIMLCHCKIEIPSLKIEAGGTRLFMQSQDRDFQLSF